MSHTIRYLTTVLVGSLAVLVLGCGDDSAGAFHVVYHDSAQDEICCATNSSGSWIWETIQSKDTGKGDNQ